MKSKGSLAVALALGWFTAGTPAEAATTNKKLGAQEFASTIEIGVAPSAVWSVLTDATKVAGAFKFEHKSGSAKFEKMGDASQVKIKEWNDDGTLVVLHVKANEEVRFAFEPSNASYACTMRFSVVASGKGSKLTFTERYTESGPQTPAEITKQSKDFDDALAKIKAAAEGKPWQGSGT